MDIEVGVDYDSDQRFLIELEKHFEIVSIALQKPGTAHLRSVNVLVVVLKTSLQTRRNNAGVRF